MSGKGSKRRPQFIPLQEFGENWAKIFEKQKQEKEADVNSTDGETDRPDAGTNPPAKTDGRDSL